MADYRHPELVRTAKTKLRIQIAFVCAAIAVVLVFIAFKFQTEDYLVSSAGEHRDRHYTRMWFDSAGVLVGVTERDTSLIVERWAGGSWEVQLTGAEATPSWTMAPDLSRVAWLAGSTKDSTMFIQKLASKNASPLPVLLPRGRTALAIGALPDASVAVAFSNGSVNRWDADTGTPLAEWHGSSEYEQAVLEGEYLAVASGKNGQAMLYRFRDDKGWQLAEESALPDPPYRIIIPAPGEIAAVTSAGVRIGRETRNSPGTVKSAVARVSDVIVTGDFDHVAVLPPDREHYRLADAKPGAILAVSESQLAVGGPNGVSLLPLATEERFTYIGRTVSYVAIALLLLALALASFGFILDLLQSRLLLWKTATATGPGLNSSLGEPPGDLIALCLSRTGVLWTGAGLSAQAGYPVRSELVKMLVQLAASDD
jgi:hypothetical protein